MPFQSKTYSCGSLGKVRRLDNLNHGQANWVNIPVTQAATNGIQLLDIQTAPNNGDHVFTVGPSVGLSASPQFFGVAVSNDGGTTWNIPGGNYQAAAGLSIDNGLLFQWNEVMVVGPQVYGVSGFSVIVGTINSIDYHGTIAVSNDGGATYNTLPWYNNLLSAPNPPMADMDCTSVHFPNLNVGVVALNLPGSLTSYVIKTTDGGGTWLVMNGQNYLTTSLFPNPPGTILPIGPITGISILANQEHIIGVGADFVVSTEPVNTGSPTAGVAADSWRNNGLTNSGVGPPVNQGFYPGIPIGWHLGTFLSPDENIVWISGDSKLGVHSIDHGESTYTVTPGPGWDGSGTGFSRRASHFYFNNLIADPNVGIIGFYNQSDVTGNKVYWNNRGFSPPFEVLSDDLPGLNYSPTALWTWYEELPPVPCYKLENCLNSAQVLYTQSTCLNGQPLGYTVQLAAPYDGVCWKIVDPLGECINPVAVTCLGFNIDCMSGGCNPTPTPCACPQGTVEVTLPNGTKVCREDIVVPAQGPQGLGCIQKALGINETQAGFTPNLWGPSSQYCRYGARFHGETSGLSWPIDFVTACTPGSQGYLDFSANTVSPIGPNVMNTLWGDGTGGGTGPYTGRFNVAGVVPDPTSCNPGVGGSRGFTTCLTVPSTTTYCFGIGGIDCEILINGLVFLDSSVSNGDIFTYENWNVFQLTLPAGTYIIQASSNMVGVDSCGNFTFNNPPLLQRNPGSVSGLAFEIYLGTAASLSTLTSLPPGVLVYSTLNEVGDVFDYGNASYNYRCPCPLPPEVCPDAFGQYNLIKPILDNCTANPLNPNANPLIYVCHTYKYTSIEDCCYLLTDCTNPAITHLTSSNLSSYIGEVITVQEYVGCFIVSQVPCGPVLEPTVTLIQSFGSAATGGCEACAPKCYILSDCEGIVPSIIVNDDLSAFVGQIINILGSTTCWQVSLSNSCMGSITVGTPTAAFATCLECKPVCYLLVNCKDPNDYKITSTDLSLYVGQVIYIEGCPGVCWQVSISIDCTGAIPVVFQQAFADCETCSPTPPPPPLELRTRSVKPGYTTPGCDPAYTEKVSCNFGSAVYDQMVILRYGITMCCNLPVDKWDIKMQLLQLAAIYDPELCKNAFEKCCAPCGMIASLTVYYPVLPMCPAPTNMIAVLTTPPNPCPAPTNMQGSIVVNPTQPCVCYLIIPTNPSVTCIFEYTNCFAVPQIVDVFGPTYVCSITQPTTLCDPSQYTLQTTPDNCASGQCGPPPIPCVCYTIEIPFDGFAHVVETTDCSGTPIVENLFGGTYYRCSQINPLVDPGVVVSSTLLDCGLGECHA